MTSRYSQVIDQWSEAAKTPEARAHIHPSGGDNEAYERGGLEGALAVMQVIPPNPGTRILDYGCGDGRVLRHLVGRYGAEIGYDTSPEMARLAATCLPRTPIVCSLDGLKVTALFSYAVFIHHTYADGQLMLVDLARTVESGGIVAVQIPLYSEPREPSSWIDVGVWTVRQLEQAAALAGLKPASLHVNPGIFSYDAIGTNHFQLQVLQKT